MNMRGGTIGTATPRLTPRTRALPSTADHRQCKGTIPTKGAGGELQTICDDTPPRTRGANPTPATRG